VSRVLRADEKLTAFVELESPILASEKQKRLQAGGIASCVVPMPNMIHVLILTSRLVFLQNSLKQDLNPGEGASPDSFFPFSDLQSQN
jgi:hypothetical protein